ncbi:class F sortase [Micromonospora sonneratiae]
MELWPKAMTSGAGGRHEAWRAAGAAVVAILALVGAGFIGAALNEAPPLQPPQPIAEAGPADLDSTDLNSTDNRRAVGDGSDGSSDMSDDLHSADSVGMTRSEPTDITIPRIGVAAKIMTLGVNPDGTVQVPPLDQAQLAGWYQPGPSPGEIGNSVIVGHVDSAAIGPAVFFHLGSLRAGDIIQITRKDQSVVKFAVDSVKSYPKVGFPTELVYGPTNKVGLRVVTCGGQFDEENRSYVNNIIVFATLID